jgi:hypothetical protein
LQQLLCIIFGPRFVLQVLDWSFDCPHDIWLIFIPHVSTLHAVNAEIVILVLYIFEEMQKPRSLNIAQLAFLFMLLKEILGT